MSATITVIATDGERVRIPVDAIAGTQQRMRPRSNSPYLEVTFRQEDGTPRTVQIAEREHRFLDMVRRLKRCTGKTDNSP